MSLFVTYPFIIMLWSPMRVLPASLSASAKMIGLSLHLREAIPNDRYSATPAWAHRYVTIITRSPGTDYSKWYHMDEGDVCYTNGERVYSRADGYDWVQLEDGGWVAAHLLGI